jgi:hypothetical protein
MPRHVIAVSLLLGVGCLVPNPAWSGSGVSSESATADTTTTSDTMLLSSGGSGDESGSGTGDALPPTAFCEPLPALPDDAVVIAAGSNVAAINDSIGGAREGATVALEPGTYRVGEMPIVIDRPGVTLRSTTGSARDVIIDGADTAPILVRMRQSDTTLAGLTLANAASDGVILAGESNIARITLTHLMVEDVVRAGVSTQQVVPAGEYVDAIEIACSHFGITEELRVGFGEACPGFRAITLYSTRDSIVRDNIFSDYFCDLVAPPSVTVRISSGSRDSIVERNRFLNHYRGVILGGEDPALVTEQSRTYADNPCEPVYWGHIGGVVRNNLFWNGSDAILASTPGTDAAISLWTVCGGAAYHNSVVSLMDPEEIFSGIEWRWPGTRVEVINNLVTASLMPRDGAEATVLTNNLELANPNEVVDPIGGDLHLAPTATARDFGIPLPAVPDDFEGDARDALPDAGADEFME